MDTSELQAADRPVLDLAARVADPDNGEVFIDRPIPFSGLLATQARAHLPMRRRQLSELLGLP
jgi:hypothetical protein